MSLGIICDGCDQAAPFVLSLNDGRVNQDYMRQALDRHGWVRTARGRHACPTCASVMIDAALDLNWRRG